MNSQPKAEASGMKLGEFDPETGTQAGTSIPIIDPEMEKRVKKKIDGMVLPLVSQSSFFKM